MELYIKFPLAICFTHGSGWRSLVGCSPQGREESDTTEWLHFQFSLSCIGEGNGSPLWCSCLENPRDRGAWWAAIYGVTQSWTWLNWLSSSSSSVYMGLLQWLSSKESTCNAGTAGTMSLIPASRRSTGGVNGNSLQYPCLKNPMDRGAWQTTVHRVTKSQVQLKRFSSSSSVYMSILISQFAPPSSSLTGSVLYVLLFIPDLQIGSSTIFLDSISVQFSSIIQSCMILCNPMHCSMPGLPVHHQLLELTQTHVHRVSDAIQPSHPLSSPFPPAFNLSQHEGLFQWCFSHQVAKVLELQLQHQSFQ